MTPGLRDLTFRELIVVKAIAQRESFALAATALGISQPAVTRTLQKLECLLGVRLFERTTRRTEITPAGRDFLACAERTLGDVHSTCVRLRRHAGDDHCAVHLSTSAFCETLSLAHVIGRYRRARAGVDIRIRERSDRDVIEDVRDGSSDFGISYVDRTPPALQVVALRTEPLVAVVPINHPLCREYTDELPLEALRSLPLVSLPLDAHLRRALDQAAACARVGLLHSVTVNRLPSVQAFVRAGAGIGIVPAGAYVATSSRAATRSIRIAGLSSTVGLVTRRDYVAPEHVTGLIDAIRHQAASPAA